MKKEEYWIKNGNNIHSICQKAIYTYGAEHQKCKAVEELAELIESMQMSILSQQHNVEEELADVEIMICQLRKMYQVETVKFEVVESGLNYDKAQLVIELARLVKAISKSIIGDDHHVEESIVNVEKAILKIRNMFNVTLIDGTKIQKLERLAGNVW